MQAVTLKEKWRLRWQLWVAVVMWWQSELWVRLCLIRYCLAIYRRELAIRRCEAADIELARIETYWAEGPFDDPSSFDKDSGTLRIRIEEEATEWRDSVTDSFLGLSWPAWGKLAALSWVGVFAASWFGVLHGWRLPEDPLNLWMRVPGISLGFMVLGNVLPGAAAVLAPAMRGRLLIVPEAAALSVMTVSGLAGIVSGTAVGLVYGMEIWLVGAGIILGIVIFPLTFGMAFPLAIPLLCSLVAWSLARRPGGISGRAYTWLMSISAAGWGLVILVGMALGLA